MKRLFRLIGVATLGLLLSLGIHALPPVSAQQPVQNQSSALMLVQTGKEHYEAGQFSDAVQVLQQAARAYETAGNKLKQAQVLSLMSLADQKLGRWQQAEAAIVASLSLLETLPDGGERTQIRAQVLNAQGRLQLAMGKAEAARKTWQDTEALYAQAGDQVGILGSQINQAEAMQSIGLYRRAEKIFAQVEQKLHQQPESLLKVTGLHNLGNILRQEGDLDRAKTLLEQSLAVAQRLHSPQASSQALLSLANTERTLAKRAQELNNSQDAKKYTQDALAHYQNAAATATSAIARTQAQLNQLSLLIETNQSTSAQSLLPQFLKYSPHYPPAEPLSMLM
jgi:tetratricopeptide (TPR) repeat protein